MTRTSRRGSAASLGPMVSIVAEGMTYTRNPDGAEELDRLADDPEQEYDLARILALRPTVKRLRALDGPTAYP